jgi:Flp pilus assembly protein TadD
MTSPAHQRAVVLQQQRRYAEAEQEWRRVILETPHDAGARAMLATCLVELDA